MQITKSFQIERRFVAMDGRWIGVRACLVRIHRPREKRRMDVYEDRQTIFYRPIGTRWELIVAVQWSAPWFAAIRQAEDAGSQAACELYYELCGRSDDPGRSLDQIQRSAYRRAFWPALGRAMVAPLVCRVRGHQWVVEHDGEWDRHVSSWCGRCRKTVNGGWF
jgi:hypothetical protein